MRWFEPLAALLLSLPLTVLAPAAEAEIYKWTDASGSLHFTANLSEVPEDQRNRARAATSQGKGSFQQIDQRKPGSAPRTPAERDAPRGASKPAAPAATPERVEGRTEKEWGAEAQNYRSAIAKLEEAAGVCEGDSFRWKQGAGRRAYKEEAAEANACAKVRSDLDMNRRWLEKLEEKAHRAGVPPGWIRD